ncbi:hypothetical protein [Nonomuraea diastatica]|uniref:Uncharacterized protein n=1 Tax=Nonomuraea diastatica TaxID=1848329 RepID=A0A4R4WJT9_9ACTN|nr:hypothetical protein [Nonomuraea diastatica]TDD18711.1 hypothetical protein E1294_23440 [Nonomuraea diastatica]
MLGQQLGDLGAEPFDTIGAQPCIRALPGEVGDPIEVLAGEAERDLAAVELAGEPGELVLLAGVPGQAEPPGAEGDGELLGEQARRTAQGGVAAVAGHRQTGPDPAIRRRRCGNARLPGTHAHRTAAARERRADPA